MAANAGLIMGLANDKSIAWGIAKACAEAGAELAFTYMGDAFKKRVDPLADQLGVDTLIDCDVGDPARSMRPLPRSRPNGASWISWCMRSDFPTRTSCAGAMWTPAATIS